MEQVYTTLLPVFGLVALGAAARRYGLVPAAAVRGLSRVLFDAAVPLVLCVQLAGARLSFGTAGPFLLAYYGASFAAFAAGLLVGRRGFRRPLEGQAISGLSASFSNCILLGLPLATTGLGPEAAVPVSLVAALQSPLMFPPVVALLQARQGRSAALRGLPRAMVNLVLRTPLLIGVMAGVAWNASGLGVPGAVTSAAAWIGPIVMPCAAFLLGAALSGYGIQGNVREAAVVVLIKTVMHPLLAWALGRYVLELPPLELAVATLLAAMPTGINVYLLAQRYDAGVRLAATCVLLSTAPSAVATAAVLTWLGGR
jgi:predicted permease